MSNCIYLLAFCLFPTDCVLSDDSRQQVQARDSDGLPLPAGAVRRLGSLRYRNVTNVSADGQKLYAFGMFIAGGSLVTMDAKTGIPTISTIKPLARAGNLVPSPDGKTGYFFGTRPETKPSRQDACICNLETGEVLFWLSDHAKTKFPRWFDFWSKATFSPDGQLLATNEAEENSNYGQIRVWDVKQGAELWSCAVDGDPNEHLQLVGFTQPGHVMGFLRRFRKPSPVRIYDRTTGRQLYECVLPAGTYKAIVGPGDTILSWTDNSTKIHQTSYKTGKEIEPAFSADENNLEAIVSRDGKTLIASAGDTLTFWDLEKRQITYQTKHSRGIVDQFFLTSDNQALWTIFRLDHSLGCFSMSDGKELVLPSSGHRGRIRQIAFSPDSRLLYSGSEDSTIRVWEVESGKEVKVIPFTEKQVGQGVSGIAVSSDGKTLAACNFHHSEIIFWDTQTWQVKDKWPTSNAPYGGVLLFFVPNQDTLAIGDPSMRGDNTFNFSFWSLATKSQVIAYPNMGNAIKFSPNGSEFASNGFNSATLWSTNHIRPLRKLALSGAITFAPDGLALASPSRKDRAILIIERATGEERFRCQGSPDELISSATYSPDGRLLASCSNKRFCFWDARSGKLLYEAVINQDVFTLEFSPDGRFLATTGNDGTIMLWSADNYRASKSPTRNLSAEELNQAWLQLNSSEASDGFKGMQTLLQSPEQAVALIKEKVKPAKLPSDQQIRQWIEDLDTKSFAARDVANKNLEELGEAISPALEKALQSKPSPEVRDRITRLLENADNGRAKEVGNLRAVEVLEWIGNQEAKKVLAILSQGSEAAYLTKAARNALDLFKHWNP